MLWCHLWSSVKRLTKPSVQSRIRECQTPPYCSWPSSFRTFHSPKWKSVPKMIEGFLTRTPLLRPFRWTGYGNLAKIIFTLGCPTQSPHFTWPWTLHVPTLQFCNESIQHFITFTWHRIHLFKIYFLSNVLSFSEDSLPFSVEFLQISRLGRRESQIILSWSHTKMSPICMWDRKTTRCTINFVMQGRRKKNIPRIFFISTSFTFLRGRSLVTSSCDVTVLGIGIQFVTEKKCY